MTVLNRGSAVRHTGIWLVFLLVSLVSCGDDRSTWPLRTLEGTWNLVGYSDHGVSGATTGEAVFRDDGTFAIDGTVTFPGEPVDTLQVSGSYVVTENIATLTTQDGSGDWSIVYSFSGAVLTLVGSDPPTSMTLKRKQ